MGGSNTGPSAPTEEGAAYCGMGASACVHVGAFRLLSMAFMERDLRASSSAERLVGVWIEVVEGAKAVAVARSEKMARRRFIVAVNFDGGVVDSRGIIKEREPMTK